jgi:hypothetical protein
MLNGGIFCLMLKLWPVNRDIFTYFTLHVVKTGSGVHPTSYTMGTGSSFPGGKAAGA